MGVQQENLATVPLLVTVTLVAVEVAAATMVTPRWAHGTGTVLGPLYHHRNTSVFHSMEDGCQISSHFFLYLKE